MGTKCAIVALALLVFASDVHCQSQSCGLKVTPAGAVRVRPGHDVTLVCDASCLGPLSRDQLKWLDPRGDRIPTQAAGVRLFAVTYNRWMLSRVVLLNPQLGDSGVYTCELRHGGQHLQYAAVVQVEDDTEVEVGPRRGDIYIEPDPDFTNTRPVRSVPSDLDPHLQGDAENDDSFPNYPGEVSDPRDSPDDHEPGDDADRHADADYETELYDNANSEPRVKNSLMDIDPEVMITSNGRNMAGMKQLSITKELSGNARLNDVKTQARIRRNVVDKGGSSTNDALLVSNDYETTTQVSTQFDYETNTNQSPDHQDTDNSFNTALQFEDMPNSTQLSTTSGLTPRDINDSVTTTVTGGNTSIWASNFPGASSTIESTSDEAKLTTTAGTPPPVTQMPAATTSTTTPAATTVKPPAQDKTTTKSTAKTTPGGVAQTKTSKTNAGTDPDFGRYGVLAFALALSAAFLLLVALLLVLLCPRFYGGKRRKHTINTPEVEGGGRHGGARPGSRGDGDGVFPMGEVPHKKLTPMTSTTGLNGEYHTAIDLDSDDPNKVKAKEGQVQEEAKKDAAEGENKEEEAKPQESFVSTFLIGRLSSSKQTEGEKLGDRSAVEGDEDVFKSPPAGADKPVTESEAKEEKEKKTEGSSSSGSSSSSSDSDAEETGKKDSSDDGNDARPASTGSGAGLMPNIRIEFKETNMDEEL